MLLAQALPTMPIKHLLVHMNDTATAVCSCYDNKLFAKLRIVSSCSYYQSCSMCIGCPNCSGYHSECSQTAEILHGGWGCIRPVPYMNNAHTQQKFSSWSLAHAFVAALARKWLYHFEHTFDFFSCLITLKNPATCMVCLPYQMGN